MPIRVVSCIAVLVVLAALLVPVASANSYRFDSSISPRQTFITTLDRDLASGEESSVEFKFAYPAEPLWMRVRLDPNERIDEFCEANNEVAPLVLRDGGGFDLILGGARC